MKAVPVQTILKWQGFKDTMCLSWKTILVINTNSLLSIISYGKDNRGKLRLMKHLVVPTLRVQPNVTQSSFSYNFGASPAVIKETTGLFRNIRRKSKLKAI